MTPVTKRYTFLAAAFIAETFFATYGLLLRPTAAMASVVYLIAGLAFVAGLLLIPKISDPGYAKKARSVVLFRWLVFGVITGLAILTATYWFAQIDVDPDYADMLPIIKVMNERLLAGHLRQVYAIIPELWGGTLPIYLPAMWLPYLATIGLGTDMRWTTVASLLLAFGFFLYLLPVRWKRLSFYFAFIAAALLFWWLFGEDDRHGVIALSEEGPVIFYYALLCIALASGNAYGIGAAIVLCGLSRYSFAGWLPAYGLILIVRREFAKIARIAGTAIAGFVLLFLLPFGWGPINAMAHLPANYTSFAARVWHDNPETFWVNLGLAKFFGVNRVVLLHHCLVYLGLGLPLLLTAWLLWKRKGNNLALAMLKFSLLVFYNLIDVPYGYLFYTSSFVSLIAVALALRSDQTSPEARMA